MVLGVGRGPLVDRVLKAANRAQKQVRVYALEKNSNAILELQEKAIEWDSRVSLVHSDMRYWEAPEQCDIMVSELLGSFGDNELSPECLDGAKKLLKPNAISIPTSYSSFISPISSSTLYEKVCDLKKPSYFETGMVVKFTKFREIAKSEKVWEFVHPQKETLIHPIGHPHFNIHNNRYSTKEFEVSSDTILHGIAGYFECVLYKDVTMSINPSTHSPDMTSWFPMYFPLREPIFLTANSKLSCSFWRTGDTRRVWYEWSAVQIVNNTRVSGSSSFIHNQNGTHSWYNL